MNEATAKRIEQLRKALESSIIDEDTYRAAVKGLGPEAEAAVFGSGAIAQGEGAVAAGAGGIAIGGNLQGDIYMGPPPNRD